MLRTIRAKLFLWFLFFISFSLIIVLITSLYISERGKVSAFRRNTEEVRTSLLQALKAQHDFLYYESINPSFFLTRQSEYIGLHDSLIQLTQKKLSALRHDPMVEEFGLSKEFRQLSQSVDRSSEIFAEMTDQLHQRGFKDFGIVGRMRFFAHELEGIKELEKADVLTLRRIEKDYIIRNDQRYIFSLMEYGSDLKERVENGGFRKSLKDSVLFLLDNYLSSFEDLIEADFRLGAKTQTGLRKELDDITSDLEITVSSISQTAQDQELRLNDNLRKLLILVISFLLCLSILISIFVSGTISRPLKSLSWHIDKFVKGGFRPVERSASRGAATEVKELEENFDILEKEIVSHIDFFKQKVEERTAELAEANQKLMRMNKANSMFVPREFLDFLGVQSIEDVKLGDHVQTNMSVMFIDIRSFSSLSEIMSPQDNFKFINGYLSRISPVIRENGGFIDKYIGDGVMALFPGSPEDALRAAVDVIDRVNEYNAFRAELGYRKPISVGIGVHKGNMILGTIGESERFDTTVISDAVNISARLESLTKFYGTTALVSKELAQALPQSSAMQLRMIDAVRVYGKEVPVCVYELLDVLDGGQFSARIRTRDLFEQGVHLAIEGHYHVALGTFNQVLKDNPHDTVAVVLRDRCNFLIQQGASPEEWDGVTRLAKV